jgi:hypothetical protein
MTTGAYSIPLYRSAVDGLVTSTDNNRLNMITKRQVSTLPYPIMTTPIRTSYIPQSYPIHANILRSSTGSMLHRVPHPRALTATTTVLRPTNIRWDSGINLVDFRTRPFMNPKNPFQKPFFLPSGTKLTRSESLQIPNMYSMNNRLMQKTKLDAKHFCGLAPIQENKLLIREIPPFQKNGTMSR